MTSYTIIRRTATTTVVLISLAGIGSVNAATGSTDPNWQPQASERLVKLPTNYLKKSIDHDFADSELGKALHDVNENIGLKMKTLGDLQAAIGKTEGKSRTELRHQLLVEKRAFLEQMSRKNELRRKYVVTKQRLLEKMMKRLKAKQGNVSGTRRALIEQQSAAHNRFESTVTTVDTRLLETTAAPDSKYSGKFAENIAAIEKLVNRIKTHRMNPARTDGKTLSKEEHLRGLLTENQADLSILDQEETVLGYMAKLVAFDAMALSEEELDAELADSDHPADTSLSIAVDLFITN